MAVYNAWTVEYLNGSTWTAVSNVQDLTCTVGRQVATQTWPVSSATIRIWYPNGYTTPIANLTQNTPIRFFAPGRSSTKPSWTGRVRDLSIEIGIPWNSATSTGNGDFLTLECQGESNSIRQQGENPPTYSFSSLTPAVWANTLQTDYSIAVGADSGTWFTANYFPFTSFGYSYLRPYVDYSTLLDSMATLYQMRICDGVKKTWAGALATDNPAVYFGVPYQTSARTASVGFSDSANNSTNRIYDAVTFDSLLDSTSNAALISLPYLRYNEVDYIRRDGVYDIRETIGVTPISPYTSQYPPITVLDESSLSGAEAKWQSVSQYLANEFWPADIAISTISATTVNQQTQNLDTLGVTDLELGYLPLYVVPVTLRGSTFYCQIEGVTVTADTNQARFTYYVTPTDTTAWFTLDSSTFGVLDANRLGIY